MTAMHLFHIYHRQTSYKFCNIGRGRVLVTLLPLRTFPPCTKYEGNFPRKEKLSWGLHKMVLIKVRADELCRPTNNAALKRDNLRQTYYRTR